MAETIEKTADAEAGAGGKRRRLLVASGLVLLLAGGAGGGAVLSLGLDGALALAGLGAGVSAEGGDAAVADAAKSSEAASAPDDVMIFDDLIVNLVRVEGSSNRYARVRVAVIYDREALGIGALEAKRQGIREGFNDFLSQLTERDLQGTYGLNVLKRELLRRARVLGGGDAVADVLVTDLVFQ
jgi:flagellar protein FliL